MFNIMSCVEQKRMADPTFFSAVCGFFRAYEAAERRPGETEEELALRLLKETVSADCLDILLLVGAKYMMKGLEALVREARGDKKTDETSH